MVEEGSGWPVPLAELRTTHNVRFVSDNAGVIAFDLPELMNRETWFFVEGHGYEVPKDGFGYRGVRLIPAGGDAGGRGAAADPPGGGWITGGGLFGESQQCGDEAEWREQGVLGCDSVQTAVHRGDVLGLGSTALCGISAGAFSYAQRHHRPAAVNVI